MSDPEQHLVCTQCDSNVTIARLPDEDGPRLVCHCTHADSDMLPVGVTAMAVLPNAWEYQEHGRSNEVSEI